MTELLISRIPPPYPDCRERLVLALSSVSVGRFLGRLHYQWLISALFVGAVNTMGRGRF